MRHATSLDNLRAEARARLQRMQAQPNQKTAPRFVWQLDAGTEYCLVVDTSRSTLYVYENVNGAPRYIRRLLHHHRQARHRKARGERISAPLSACISSRLIYPKAQLADMYGSGAFPLSYPNEWDKKNNRTGQGLWLHGTPSDTYSRPPRASDEFGGVVAESDLSQWTHHGLLLGRIDLGEDRNGRTAPGCSLRSQTSPLVVH